MANPAGCSWTWDDLPMNRAARLVEIRRRLTREDMRSLDDALAEMRQYRCPFGNESYHSLDDLVHHFYLILHNLHGGNRPPEEEEEQDLELMVRYAVIQRGVRQDLNAIPPTKDEDGVRGLCLVPNERHRPAAEQVDLTNNWPGEQVEIIDLTNVPSDSENEREEDNEEMEESSEEESEDEPKWLIL